MGKCQGQDSTNKRVFLATRVVYLSPNVGGVLYINEYQFSFEKYIIKLQEAYSTLTRYQNVLPAQFRVQRMLDRMQLSNALTIDINKARVLDNLLEDCLSSISYMSSKVKIQFPPRSGGGIERKGDRRIPTFYFKRVRGGGRGRGRGQDLAAAAVITLDLTGKTHPMTDFVDCTAMTSGGVYPSDNLTRLGVMGACM